VTTPQSPVAASPASASAARAGVAQARRELGISAEMDDQQKQAVLLAMLVLADL
jgi:hypothetical protein